MDLDLEGLEGVVLAVDGEVAVLAQRLDAVGCGFEVVLLHTTRQSAHDAFYGMHDVQFPASSSCPSPHRPWQ